MKTSLILSAIFAFSSSAFAMPSVGDDSVFALTNTMNGQTVTGTVEIKLISHNTSNETWDERESITVNGQSQTQDQSVATSQLLTDATAQQILASCASIGGKAQSITVPAGTFNTCSIPSSSNGSTGTVWISTVTFGVVQSDETASNGEHVVLKLVSTHSGT